MDRVGGLASKTKPVSLFCLCSLVPSCLGRHVVCCPVFSFFVLSLSFSSCLLLSLVFCCLVFCCVVLSCVELCCLALCPVLYCIVVVLCCIFSVFFFLSCLAVFTPRSSTQSNSNPNPNLNPNTPKAINMGDRAGRKMTPKGEMSGNPGSGRV
jgi:hypothetical protein